MKKPANIDKLSPHSIEYALGPYPPLGFVPVSDAELGNGDYYGLYWPIGKENEYPVVCDMFHDEGSIKLAFSSTEKFLEWLDINDWERGENDVSDEDFAPFHYQTAKTLLSNNDVEGAIESLNQAISSFSEDSDYWFSLSSQLKRVGDHEASAIAAVNAFVSNWSFSFPSAGVLRILQNKSVLEMMPSDPVVKRAGSLTMNYGGEKENSNYALLRDCIEEYLTLGDNIKAITLYQNFAYMMSSETTSFQERNKFDLSEWRNEFSELCLSKLGDNRRFKA